MVLVRVLGCLGERYANGDNTDAPADRLRLAGGDMGPMRGDNAGPCAGVVGSVSRGGVDK